MTHSFLSLLAAASLAGCSTETVAWTVPAGSVADAGYQQAAFTPPANVFAGPIQVAESQAMHHAGMGGMDHASMDHSKMGHGAKATAKAAAAPASVQATGVVRSVDAAGSVVKLAHDPIPAIGWPKMVMDFKVRSGVDLSKLKPGDKVGFTLQPASGDEYTVTSIAAAAGAQTDHSQHGGH
jgi:Cu(I)/Ag(I) efflux system periplasmic protein CusF